MPSVKCQILRGQIPFFNIHLPAELLHSRERIRVQIRVSRNLAETER